MKQTRLILLLATSVLLASCSDSNDDNSGAELRVLHGSPDAPNVDVIVDQSTVLTNVSYPTASDYLSVDTGARRIRVNAAGTSTTVIDATVPLSEGVAYTAIATNTLSNIEPLLTVDERSSAPSGKVRVRVIHGAPGAPAVDVYVTAPDADIANASPTLSAVSYKGVSSYLEIPAGDYRARVTAAGSKGVVIDSGTLNLESGLVASVVALDATGGGAPFQLKVLKDNR